MHMRRGGGEVLDDIVSPSHRDMAVFLMQGVPPERILAQYMGRKTGLTRGRDGNMHMGDLRHRLIAFVSHLGDSIPVAAGGRSEKRRVGEEGRARGVPDH